MKFLYKDEIAKLMEGASLRDRLLILLAYRHGFRVSELLGLTWDDIDLERKTIKCRRLKNGRNTTQPLSDREIELLNKLEGRQGPLFTITRRGVNYVLKRLAEKKLGKHVHIHMLRHSTGHSLINNDTDLRIIQTFLGHKSISSTCIYTSVEESTLKACATKLEV